jgi:hypothetical protein
MAAHLQLWKKRRELAVRNADDEVPMMKAK